MDFFQKVENGWKICDLSLKVLKANKKLLIFPILSGISLIIILFTFFVGIGPFIGWDFDSLAQSDGTIMHYLILFLVYLINYTVIIFFNIALMHCVKLYFEDKQVSLSIGVKYSLSRFGYIIAWAAFAATVGLVLKIIQDNVGKLGKFIIGFLGFAWSVSTFFAVPIIAYEDKNPWDALKESLQMMKKLWGESLTASFSFGLIQFGALVLMLMIAFLLGMVNGFLGLIFFIIGFVLIISTFSALKCIFISAIYNKVSSDINVKEFANSDVTELFNSKK